MKGVLLEELTWLEAERVLTPDAVVVIPLGAAAKEHGPHLRLDNDRTLAEYFRDRLRERAAVVVTPTITYHYYPAFVEYPGSVTLRLETARDLVVDIVRSLARFGPRRFYVLNTGVSTAKALGLARTELERHRILLGYTDLAHLTEARRSIAEQAGGTHADEIETSMLLYIAPDRVDSGKAVKDYDPGDKPGLSRTPSHSLTHSRSGVYGDPTLATAEKGRRMVAAYIETIVRDIEALSRDG